MQRQPLFRWALWLMLLAGQPALASWQEMLPGAQVIGSGEFRMYGFDIYNARMWSATRPLSRDQPFALELIYQRTISRDDLVDASLDEIKRLSGPSVSAGQLAQWQAQMQLSFVDVQAGMRITGVYLPGQGAQFYVGQHLQNAINDPQFARAFFDIWLDPRTRNPQLRVQLLGLDKP